MRGEKGKGPTRVKTKGEDTVLCPGWDISAWDSLTLF